MTDLFGEEPVTIPNPQAYAGTPGRGPTDKVCGQCAHYTRTQCGAGIYLKCGLNRGRWTSGAGTDIKAKTPACELFLIDSGN